MMRVTAFVGSARKRSTYRAVRQFLNNLQALGEFECEIVALSDYRIETCRGCKGCFERGEEHCPLKDDRDVLIEKMLASDGIVFASPNYSFNVSAIMKTFLDRLGFAFHRPRFFGKTFTSIVAQGIYGGDKIASYLDFVGNGLGFNAVKGSCITALEPMTEKEQQKIDKELAAQSRRFYKRLLKAAHPRPTLFNLMAFRMARTSMGLMLDDRSRDFTYFREKGWFESEYYYPVRLGFLKSLAGRLIDAIAAMMARSRESGSAPPGEGSRPPVKRPSRERATAAVAGAARPPDSRDGKGERPWA
jgi:multimeric flavodoxin WrbA